MEHSNSNKKFLAVFVIGFLIGFMIGSAVGAYQSLNWVIHKAEYFVMVHNQTIDIDWEQLTTDLIRYKTQIDSRYP